VGLNCGVNTNAHRRTRSAGAHAAATEGGVALASEDYRTLFEEHAAVMLVVDTQSGRIVAANPSAGRFYGWPVSQLAGKPLGEISALPGAAFQDRLREISSGPAHFECRHRLADGTMRDVEVFGSRIVRRGRSLSYLIVYDISARLAAEAAIRASEAERREEEAQREREDNFRVLLDTLTDMLVVAGLEGNVLFANKTVEAKLGYTHDEILQMRVLDFHPEELRDEAEAILGDMLRGERSTCPLPLLHKDGSYVPVATRVWFGTWSGTNCIFAVIQDLTAEEEANQRLERLFRHNPTPMALASLPDRSFTDVNDAFLATFGYARAEVVGRCSEEVGLWRDSLAWGQIAERLEQEGRISTLELKARRKDGETVEGLFSGEVIRSQGEEFFLIVMIDITARKRAEKALALERERLARIIEGTNVGTWQWDIPSGEMWFDERWASIVGYTLEELEPTSIETWKRLCHSDDVHESDAVMRQHFSGEREHYELEIRMRHKNGDWIWVLDRGKVATWTADGKPAMMFGTWQEVTQRKRTEEELRRRVAFDELLVAANAALFVASEQELDPLLNHVLRLFGEFVGADRSYVFRYDSQGEMMSNTHEWCSPGIPPEKDNLQDLPVSMFPAWMEALRRCELVHIPDVSKLPASWRAEREILEPQGILTLLVLPVSSGSRSIGFIGFDSVRRHREWGAEERSLLGVLSDNVGVALDRAEKTRDLRLASEKAHRLAQQAENANHTKSLFLANMSHEIRTPMNAILGFAQVLERDARLGPGQLDNVRAIIRGGDHLLSLINDVLDMSKIEAGRTNLTSSSFSLHRLFVDLQMSFRARSREKGVNFSVNGLQDLPERVVGDEGKLRQILLNLVGNAFKFTDEGQVHVNAWLRRKPQSDRGLLLEVEVSDTGSGIALEDQGRLFQPFVQVGSGARSGGTGLGLAITRKFVELMGGQIWVSSTLGDGSVFRFVVQLKSYGAGRSEAPVEHRVVGLIPGDRSPRLLVVDDVEDNREMLSQLLGPLGFEVMLAESGKEALERVDAIQPDAILMDMRMPELDGWESTARLKACPERQAIPVVAVTAGAFEEDERRAIDAGADAYVRKPFRQDELLAVLGRLLGLEFRYEEEERPVPDEPSGDSLPVPDVSGLPSDVLSLLRRAVQEGDIAELMVTLDSWQDAAPRAVEFVRRLAENYEYEELEQLLTGEEWK
jgi:PAS domain S-box-containing protein